MGLGGVLLIPHSVVAGQSGCLLFQVRCPVLNLQGQYYLNSIADDWLTDLELLRIQQNNRCTLLSDQHLPLILLLLPSALTTG